MTVTIFHNPRCSKSRQTLKLIQEKGLSPTIVEYLKDAPSAAELQVICTKLGQAVRTIVRSKETEYRSLGLNDESLADEEIFKILSANPKLIERPIVISGDKACIGRPPEKVFEIL